MSKPKVPVKGVGILPPAEADRAAHSPVRLRAFVLGLPLMVLAGLWIFGGEMGGAVQRYTFATWAAPFYNAIYILLVISLLNLLAKALLRRVSMDVQPASLGFAPLDRAADLLRSMWRPVNVAMRALLPLCILNSLELLAIYAMVSVGSALFSSDLQGILVTLMGYPTYFADDVNRWNEVFDGALPRWLMVNDTTSMLGFYKGNSSFWRPENYLPWLKPIAAWTLFIWALMMMMLCVNTVLRRAWIDRERLTFPIVALPIAMTDQPESFFSNKLMWMGFALAALITFSNGLHDFFPQVPVIPIKRQDYPIASSGPFLAMGSVRVCFYFFAITLGFLMPLDLSFSLYFFYLLFKLEAVGVSLLGVPPESGFPYTTSQAFGAYSALFVVSIWGLRRHLADVWRIAFSPLSRFEDEREPMRYRSAIIWFFVCSMCLLLFAVAAGMKPLVALVFFGVYLALMVMITRIRAEFGFPVHDMHFMAPDQTMIRVLGVGPFDRSTLGAFSLFYWFNRVYRSHPMPHQLEAMKMAGSDGSAQRAMLRAVVIAGMVAVPLCFAIYLNGFYHYGAATANFNQWSTGYGREAFGRLENSLSALPRVEPGEGIATAAGFGLAMMLAVLRRNLVGFPFHPLAYAVANSWGVMNLWLPILIGSVCKAAVLKGSGLSGYRRATMLFFGLMLGEFFAGCTWTILGLLLKIPTYDFWP